MCLSVRPPPSFGSRADSESPVALRPYLAVGLPVREAAICLAISASTTCRTAGSTETTRPASPFEGAQRTQTGRFPAPARRLRRMARMDRAVRAPAHLTLAPSASSCASAATSHLFARRRQLQGRPAALRRHSRDAPRKRPRRLAVSNEQEKSPRRRRAEMAHASVNNMA